MEAAALLDLIERSRRSRKGPLPEALASAIGEVLLAWLVQEHAQTPPRLHREAFARLGCMSPEQARGRLLDVRSDVFSIGVLLFELACGRAPFNGISELVAGDIDAPKAVNPEISDALSGVLARALALEPSQRFATATELRTALETAVPPAGPDAVVAWTQAQGATPPPASPRARFAPLRWLGAAALVGVPIAATLVGLRIQEQHQDDAQRAYTATLRPCEIISEPPGATLFVDGRLYSERAPTLIRLEPGRDYAIELRSTTGSASRRIRDQKKLAVRLRDGTVTENETYGMPPPPKPKAVPPAAQPAGDAPQAKEEAARPAAYDFEKAPVAFELTADHQLVIPEANCFPVTGTTTTLTQAPSGIGKTEMVAVPKSKANPPGQVTPDNYQRSMTAANGQWKFELPLLSLFTDGKQTELQVLTHWVTHAESGTLCVFMLSDRSTDTVPNPALLELTNEELRSVRKPLVYVDGSDRLLVRSLSAGSWRVKVEGNKPGFAPVMVYEHSGIGMKREALVLSEPITVVKDVKWLWLTVPVRTADPDLRFSVRIEKLR